MSWDRAGSSRPDPSDKREANHVEGEPQPFTVHTERPRLLLIGEDAGIGPMISLAERLRGNLASSGGRWKPLVLMGSETPFPFRPRPSSIIVAGIPGSVIACMPLLEEWGIPSRLASNADLPGCFDGVVTQLADAWLASLGPAELGEVEIFACGPAPMLEATRALAGRFAVACQTSLEEFLARAGFSRS
jgi:dihydroorotate dehydrogenase electron transfer subunit